MGFTSFSTMKVISKTGAPTKKAVQNLPPRDSNPRPLDHLSDALPPELSRPPVHYRNIEKNRERVEGVVKGALEKGDEVGGDTGGEKEGRAGCLGAGRARQTHRNARKNVSP